LKKCQFLAVKKRNYVLDTNRSEFRSRPTYVGQVSTVFLKLYIYCIDVLDFIFLYFVFWYHVMLTELKAHLQHVLHWIHDLIYSWIFKYIYKYYSVMWQNKLTTGVHKNGHSTTLVWLTIVDIIDWDIISFKKVKHGYAVQTILATWELQFFANINTMLIFCRPPQILKAKTRFWTKWRNSECLVCWQSWFQMIRPKYDE